MVNIKAIIYIGTSRCFCFGSHAAYLDWCESTSTTAAYKDKLKKNREKVLAFEQALAVQYNMDPEHIKSVTISLGCLQEAKTRFEDEYTRNLLCNPAHRVIIQIRAVENTQTVITTVYRPHDCEIIHITMRSPATRDPSHET